MTVPKHLIVAGAGPAGAVAAISLTRLGYEVSIVSTPRAYGALEGLSQRAIQNLLKAGCRHAASIASPPSARHCVWNGLATQVNSEHLINRELFDAALLQDLTTSGVSVIRGRVQAINHTETGVTVEIKGRNDNLYELTGSFFIEARGRNAPNSGRYRQRGPETLSLLQYWQGERCSPLSSIVSFPEGWAWLARFTDGRRYTQVTIDAKSADIPAKPKLYQYLLRHLEQMPEALSYYQGCEPCGDIMSRAATSIRQGNPVGPRSINIGDAALSVDPLSGNGVFQAISTALAAPAVVNTLLRKPEQAQSAKRFYRERIRHSFAHFSQIGREFYRMEKQWPDHPFWARRQNWPENESASPSQLKIVTRPVLENYFICEKQVVLLPEHPMGVWHVNGILLAPIIRKILEGPQLSPQSLRSYLDNEGIVNKSIQKAIADSLNLDS